MRVGQETRIVWLREGGGRRVTYTLDSASATHIHPSVYSAHVYSVQQGPS